MSTCSGCGAEITWVVVAKSGKRMPLDPDPVPLGNVAFLTDTTVEVVMKGGGLLEDRPLYVSHFSTCTDPTRFRKQKSPRPR